MLQTVTIHGHKRAFLKVGNGPALLLLHGLACDHSTWDPVIRQLAKRYTVIAPDLLGHGQSDKPRADYSLGGYANAMRDLLTVLDIDRVTVVGHSFGGGVAMQFGYQYPERTDRLVLVSSGGLGPEVTPAIRAITLPGFKQAMGVLTMPGLRHVGKAAMRSLATTGVKGLRDLDEAAEIYEFFSDPRARAAIQHVVRAVVDWRGQVVTMADRAYLTEHMPMLVVWGSEDAIIPARHADTARRLAPGARVEVLPNSGHFPHRDHPERFVKLLNDFVAQTAPSHYDQEVWREVLRSGGSARVRQAEAGDAPVAPVTQLHA